MYKRQLGPSLAHMCFHVRYLSLTCYLAYVLSPSLVCSLSRALSLSLSPMFSVHSLFLTFLRLWLSLSLPGNVDGDILAGGPGQEQEELVEQSGQELDVHPCLHSQQ